MVTNRAIARYGMVAVGLTGAVLAVVGFGLLAEGFTQGRPPVALGGYALGGLGGALSAVFAWHHREPGATAALAGAPAAMGAVAMVFAATDPGTPVLPLVLVAVALALVGSTTATYAEATE